MPTVELPDGTQIEFPEGTDQATINKASADTWAKMQGGAGSAAPAPSAPTDRFAGKSLDDLKKYYQQRQFIGAKPEELAAVSDAYVKKEQSEGGFGLALDDTLRQVAKGVPILGGSLDEIAAGASSLMGGNYNEALDYQRARDRFIEKGAPVLSTGLQVAGGIGGTLAGANAIGLGGMGVNSSVPLAQRALAGVAVGTPVGAADAFTRGEGGAENRGAGAILGGILGGITGGVAPVIGQGLSSAFQNVKNFLTPGASYSKLGISQPVGEELVDLMGADAGTKGIARIRAAGPDAMIADAGPNAQGIADAVIQKRGPGASVLGTAVEERAKKASRDLTRSLDRTFGAPEGKVAQITTIREGSAEAREAAYNNAYSKPIDYADPKGQKVESLFSRIPSEAWGYANKLMKVEGSKSKQILFDIAEDGTVNMKTMPDVRQLDYVKRAIDAVAEMADGQGRLGGQTAMGRAFKNLAVELRDSLKSAVPEYGKALQSAADPISRIEGIKLGTKLLSPQFTRAELKEAMEGMTGPERQAVVSGIRAQLDEVMANVRGMASDPNVDARQLNEMVRNLTSKATREKIGIVLDDPKKTMQFFREIGQAFKAAELRAGVATNSKTATRTQAILGIDERLQPGVVGTAMEGNLPGATKKAIQVATGATPRQQRLRNNEQWLELARALSEKRGRDAEDLLRKLIAASQIRARTSATGKTLGTAGAGAVAGANPVLVEGIN
jgi:hypothetical protein